MNYISIKLLENKKYYVREAKNILAQKKEVAYRDLWKFSLTVGIAFYTKSSVSSCP